MACFWCLGSGSLVACNHCPRCFCYNCYKSRHSYGIINWAKVLKEPNFHCPVCTGKEPASNEGGECSPATNSMTQVLVIISRRMAADKLRVV